MSDSFSLKDHLFNAQKINQMSDEIMAVFPGFNRELFVKTVLDPFPELALKARISWISVCLRRYLPSSYSKAIGILLKSLPPACDPTKSDDDFGDFIYAPYNHFIAEYGCTDLDVDRSLSALEVVTTRFSAEDAIRKFIISYPDITFRYLRCWVKHPHYHVRRLVSEGTRPSLPWSVKIPYDPEKYLLLLDDLHLDSTRFVTRSIANHLNDVSKFNPDIVLARLTQWHHLGRQSQSELAYITRHGLRTLIKNGYPKALRYLGYKTEIDSEVDLVLHQSELSIGDALTFTITILPKKPERLLIDYILTFQTKNGRGSQKVFKLKTLNLTTDIRPIVITKTYRFTKAMTTRAFYTGEHAIQLQINGIRYPQKIFWLN